MSVIGSIGRRRLWILAFLVATSVVGGGLGVKWHRSQRACERRGAALDARVERIKRGAQHLIDIGAVRRDKPVLFSGR
jgi:hypothetical protein